MKIWFGLAAGALLLAGTATAQATVVTVVHTGVFTYDQPLEGQYFLGASVHAGDAFTLTFTYDLGELTKHVVSGTNPSVQYTTTTTHPTFQATLTGNGGSYSIVDLYHPPFSVDSGRYVTTLGGNSYNVSDQVFNSDFLLSASDSSTNPIFSSLEFTTPFSYTTTADERAANAGQTYLLEGYSGVTLYMTDYTVTSSTSDDAASPAPEPATWALMLVGFGTVGYGMRRRRPVVRFG